MSSSFSQDLQWATSSNDTCSEVLIPTIIVKCTFDRELGWHQEASIETEQFINECPIDSVQLLVFDTLNGSISDTIFNLFSDRIQINQNDDNCWTSQLLPAKLFIYSHGTIVSSDSMLVQISILEVSKKCTCSGNKGAEYPVFAKVSLEFNQNRNKATKLRLNKKKYSSKFIEYNYEEGKRVKVDKLNKIKGKIYIDETHLSTSFSRNNKFPEAEYKVLVNSQENDLIVLVAESRREDGDLMIWKVVIKSGKIDLTAMWYSSGELKTMYIVKSK